MADILLEIKLSNSVTGRVRSYGKHIAFDQSAAAAAESLAKELRPKIDGTPWADFQTVRVVVWRGPRGTGWSEQDASIDTFIEGMKRCGARLDEWAFNWRERWRVKQEKYEALKRDAEAKQ